MGVQDFIIRRGIQASRASFLSQSDEYGKRPKSLPSKVLEGGFNVLSYLGDKTTRNVFLPIAKWGAEAEGDYLKQARLRQLGETDDKLFLGDVLTTQLPQLAPTADEPLLSPMGALKRATTFTADVAGDPISYAGLGLLTKTGRVRRAISAAKTAKQPVKLSSSMARKAAELQGAPKVSANVIRKTPELGKTFHEQVKRGERALASFEVPFSDISFPLPFTTGPLAAKISRPLTAGAEYLNRARLGNRFVRAFDRAFSSRSGNPDFDRLRAEFRDLALARSSGKIEQGKQLQDMMKTLSKRLGVPRKDLNRFVTETVERETAGTVRRGFRAGKAGIKHLFRDRPQPIREPKIISELLGEAAEPHIELPATEPQAPRFMADVPKNAYHGTYRVPSGQTPMPSKTGTGILWVAKDPSVSDLYTEGFQVSGPKGDIFRMTLNQSKKILGPTEALPDTEKFWKGVQRLNKEGKVHDFEMDSIDDMIHQEYKEGVFNDAGHGYEIGASGEVTGSKLFSYLEDEDEALHIYKELIQEQGFDGIDNGLDAIGLFDDSLVEGGKVVAKGGDVGGLKKFRLAGPEEGLPFLTPKIFRESGPGDNLILTLGVSDQVRLSKGFPPSTIAAIRRAGSDEFSETLERAVRGLTRGGSEADERLGRESLANSLNNYADVQDALIHDGEKHLSGYSRMVKAIARKVERDGIAKLNDKWARKLNTVLDDLVRTESADMVDLGLENHEWLKFKSIITGSPEGKLGTLDDFGLGNIRFAKDKKALEITNEDIRKWVMPDRWKETVVTPEYIAVGPYTNIKQYLKELHPTELGSKNEVLFVVTNEGKTIIGPGHYVHGDFVQNYITRFDKQELLASGRIMVDKHGRAVKTIYSTDASSTPYIKDPGKADQIGFVTSIGMMRGQAGAKIGKRALQKFGIKFKGNEMIEIESVFDPAAAAAAKDPLGGGFDYQTVTRLVKFARDKGGPEMSRRGFLKGLAALTQTPLAGTHAVKLLSGDFIEAISRADLPPLDLPQMVTAAAGNYSPVLNLANVVRLFLRGSAKQKREALKKLGKGTISNMDNYLDDAHDGHYFPYRHKGKPFSFGVLAENSVKVQPKLGYRKYIPADKLKVSDVELDDFKQTMLDNNWEFGNKGEGWDEIDDISDSFAQEILEFDMQSAKHYSKITDALGRGELPDEALFMDALNQANEVGETLDDIILQNLEEVFDIYDEEGLGVTIAMEQIRDINLFEELGVLEPGFINRKAQDIKDLPGIFSNPTKFEEIRSIASSVRKTQAVVVRGLDNASDGLRRALDPRFVEMDIWSKTHYGFNSLRGEDFIKLAKGEINEAGLLTKLKHQITEVNNYIDEVVEKHDKLSPEKLKAWRNEKEMAFNRIDNEIARKSNFSKTLSDLDSKFPGYFSDLNKAVDNVTQAMLDDIIASRPLTPAEIKNSNWLGRLIKFQKDSPHALSETNALVRHLTASAPEIENSTSNILRAGEIEVFHDAVTLAKGQLTDQEFTSLMGRATTASRSLRDNILSESYGFTGQPGAPHPVAQTKAMTRLFQDILEYRDLLRVGVAPANKAGMTAPTLTSMTHMTSTDLGKNLKELLQLTIEDPQTRTKMAADIVEGIARGIPQEVDIGTEVLFLGQHMNFVPRSKLIQKAFDLPLGVGEEGVNVNSIFKALKLEYPNLFNTPVRYFRGEGGKRHDSAGFMGALSRSFNAAGLRGLSQSDLDNLVAMIAKKEGKIPKELVSSISSIVHLNPLDRARVMKEFNFGMNLIGLHATGKLTSRKLVQHAARQIKETWRNTKSKGLDVETKNKLIGRMMEYDQLSASVRGTTPESLIKGGKEIIQKTTIWKRDKPFTGLPQYIAKIYRSVAKDYSNFLSQADAIEPKDLSEIKPIVYDIMDMVGIKPKDVMPSRNITRRLINRSPEQMTRDYRKWIKNHELGHRFMSGGDTESTIYSVLPKSMRHEYNNIFRRDKERMVEVLDKDDMLSIHENFANAHGFFQTFPQIMGEVAPSKFAFFRKLYQPGKVELKPHPQETLKDIVDALAETKPAEAQALWDVGHDVVNYKQLDYYVAPKVAGDPGFQQIVRVIKERQQRQLMVEQTSGVKVIPLTADIDYIAHVLTPEARDLISDSIIKGGSRPTRILTAKEFSTRLANAARREFVQVNPAAIDQLFVKGIITKRQVKGLKGKNGLEKLDDLLERDLISEEAYTNSLHTLTVSEVNELASQGKLRITGFKPVEEFFHVDPVYSTTVRGVRGERARTAVEFYDSLIEQGIGMPHNQAPGEWLPVKQPELLGIRFEPEVARHLDNFYKTLSKPEEVNAFLQMFDTVQDAWKAWTLAIFPAYHSRNFVGNIWNNFLAGLSNPKFYQMAGKLQRGGTIDFVDGLGKRWTEDTITKAAKSMGVVDRGWVGAEIQRTITQELQAPSFFRFGAENKVVKAGFRVGRSIENNARMAHFIWRLSRGDTASQAAVSVKKHLFDYSELTEFERRVMKRLFPFYTWTRKNVPLQIQHLIQRPGKFGLLFKAREEAERGTPPAKEKYLPDWMIQNFPTRIRYNTKNDQHEYFLLNAWLPAHDVIKVFELHETALGMLSPLPKELIQQIYNYDFFMKRKIEQVPGQRERFLGREDIPTRIVHGAKIIRLLNEIDKLTDPERDLFLKVTSLLTGKTYPFNESKAARSHRFRIQAEIDEIQSALKRAQRKGNANEADRLRALLQEKSKEF